MRIHLDPNPDTETNLHKSAGQKCLFYKSIIKQCCATVTIYYGSGSGSDF
jgi:hypothetical protein